MENGLDLSPYCMGRTQGINSPATLPITEDTVFVSRSMLTILPVFVYECTGFIGALVYRQWVYISPGFAENKHTDLFAEKVKAFLSSPSAFAAAPWIAMALISSILLYFFFYYCVYPLCVCLTSLTCAVG